MILAIFDLDNTLLGGDSDHAWGEFMAEKGMVDEDYRRGNDRFLEAYQAGRLDVLAYLEFLARPLSRYPLTELQRLHQEFMQTKIRPMYLPRAKELVDEHRARGDRLLVMTSTIRFITEPICALYGIHELLATELEIQDDYFTGRVQGTPCFGPGKVLRLKQWLKDNEATLDGSRFYSDSLTDLPLLEFVDHAVAVDPEPSLRQVAAARDWPLISLRN
ncbi:MAG: HAD-IB family hydrolase [Desulfohalobiaceae bacterium]|nr:HAD-IB family hydrolase [Desulfohalobiaceae bacterium]